MSITISGHHLSITPAIRSYVEHKFARISRHFSQLGEIRVLLSVEQLRDKENRQKAECNIHVKGHDLFAASHHQSLYSAVDELAHKLDKQVVRHKDKLQDHHPRERKRKAEDS